MNPLWGLFFKDRFRTPFSVYKMSLAELFVLGGIIFGFGYGLTKGVQKLLSTQAEVTAEKIEE